MSITTSIVIPVYNDYRIKRCLSSLSRQTYPKEKFEILLVENGPLQQFEKTAVEYGAQYLYTPIKNMAGARNIGLNEARGKYILFTDADCVINSNWVKEMVNKFEKTNYVGLGGRIQRYSPKTRIEKMGKNLAWGQDKLQYLQILDLPYIVFANAGFLRDNLIAVGGFDVELLSGNDVDICWKLGLKNWKIGTCEAAIVFHENRKTIKKYFKVYFRYGKYQSLLFKKYRKVADRSFMINTYAPSLFFKAIKNFSALFRNDPRPWYDIVEACGVIFGHIYGSFCFKTFYI